MVAKHNGQAKVMDRKYVGEQVLRIRNKAKLSQRELAAKVGVNRQQIGQIELGRERMTLDLAEKIAAACQTSLADFLGLRTPTTDTNMDSIKRAHERLQAILDAGGNIADYTTTVIEMMHLGIVTSRRSG